MLSIDQLHVHLAATGKVCSSEELPAEYENYKSKIARTLEDISKCPWNSRGLFVMTEDKMVACGAFKLQDDGLYKNDSDNEKHIMVSDIAWPETITFQCVSKPAVTNTARYYFGLRADGVFDMVGYCGPSFNREPTYFVGKHLVAHNTRGNIYIYNGQIQYHIIRPSYMIIFVDYEGKRYQHIHSSLDEKAVVKIDGKWMTYKYADPVWVLTKVTE